ncbi:P-loop containing nucleoside triphosphate hydrolase protein [Lasiosphaeria ovina]|uniref:P-loop containing nucleoside triphosphate hydrolase protein n=1 Tax=Lasiosphaeria ovina TaxID=92902 RepID=A0AAE0N5K4_9PEZI|nr:P-loop containing nucleoside triphosphate hydrolase protein [Lasiosphaeria ovina]
MSFDSHEYQNIMALNARRAAEAAPVTVRSSEINSRVMVDYESYSQYGQADVRNGPLRSDEMGPGCSCTDCANNLELARKYRTRFDEPKFANAKEWEDEQYLLCAPRVLGYILDQKQWAQLQVNLLHRLSAEEDSMDAWNSRLKLADDTVPDKRKKGKKGSESQSTKDLLFDLVRSHISSNAGRSDENVEDSLEVDDIIPGKGKGLVILLYGPPGVGKTSTAETIAIATKKPLFSVSVADVGTQAKHVESNLSRIFSLATRWQAILLIDEADVFLESRGRGSAIRSTDKNALVSVFLRVLEYYQGIMFLTTNQIAEFDIAIPSRIHVSIQYESLKDYQMEAIFHGFLDKLDQRGLVDDYDGIKDWLEEVVYKEKFDGRQIRNTVTTALGLARAETKYRGQGGRLRKDHLKRAFANVSAFKRDFNTQWERYKESQKQLIK